MSHINNNIFKTIKQATDCINLAYDLGLELSSSGMIRCPDPAHEDYNPSCQVNPTYLYCHGCGQHWDCFDLVMLAKGWDLLTAAKWLAERCGIPWPEQSEEARQEYEREFTRQEKLQFLLKGWQNTIQQKKDALEYLQGRGFTLEFIRQQGWGFCSENRPADPDTAQELGLVSAKGYYIASGRIVIPFFRYGKVIQIAFHKPGGDPKYLYPAGWSKSIISNAIPTRHDGPVYLAEGVFDYFSLLSVGLPAVTTLGVMASEAQKKELTRFKDLVVLFDNDPAGKAAAQDLVKELFPAARCPADVFELPTGKKDLNGLLQENGPEKFKSLVENYGKEAKNYLDHLTAHITDNPGDNKALREIVKLTARIDSEIEREARLLELKKVTKIALKAFRADIAKIRGENQQTDEEENGAETQADILINIATAGAFLFHDETKDGFAQIEINGHKEVHPLRSKFFRQWLVRQYYQQTEKSPNNEAVRQALGVIEAKAVFDGPEHKLHLRVAEHDGAIWYDLANEKWQAVKITADGWEVVDDPPIMFRRFKNTAAQVLPERGGCLELLRRYINLKNDNDWLLMHACDAVFLIPGVPHSIPIFYGDKGAAKTTAQRVIRKLVDPAHRDTMTLPTDKNEMALLLMTNYAPCFDNLDGLQAWQSDMLCQAATGGGISKRELYSDMDEVILSFLRCPMLNGINLVASRDDLLDRSVLFQLNRIDEDDRKEEKHFWDDFEKDRPFILGALFDAVSAAMRIYPTLKLDRLPRMADFARWGYAIAEAIGKNGEQFLAAYYRNIKGAVEEAVLADPVSAAVVEFMDGKERWDGTATELLELLSELPGIDIKSRYWPKRSHTLTRRLNKIKSALTDYGIKVEPWRKGSTRGVTLRRKKIASQASKASKAREHRHSDGDAFKTEASSSDAIEMEASLHEPRENRHSDTNDANDAFSSTPGESVINIKKNDDDLREVTL